MTGGIQQKPPARGIRTRRASAERRGRDGLGDEVVEEAPPSAGRFRPSAFAEDPTMTVRFRFAAASQALYLRVQVTPRWA